MAERVRAALGVVAVGDEPRPGPVSAGPLLWSSLDDDGDGAPTLASTPGVTPSAALGSRVRLDPGRRGATAVAIAAVAAAVLTGAWVLSARPHTVPVTAPAGGSTSTAPTVTLSRGRSDARTSAAPSGPPVVVDVIGRVRRPGLYTLPAGSRVYNAVMAAGGPVRGVNLDSLNLAARVSDGQQIAVGVSSGMAPPGGVVGAAGSSGAGSDGGAGSGGSGGLVNLNSATLDQLVALPGVGPVLAQHILDWRSAHGTFASVDQLRDVTGIGEVKFAALRGLVTV